RRPPPRACDGARPPLRAAWEQSYLRRVIGSMKPVVILLAVAVTAAVIPVRLCAHEAFAAPDALEAGVAEIIDRPLKTGDFPTGSPLLDGEWLFATSMMAAMGFGQVALEHPERKSIELPRIKKCIARLINERRFDTVAWHGDDALAHLDSDEHAHGSYLGYMNLVLS